ncbi:HU family DNA-binding protein [Sphingosinicellaceae bacterium M-36]
MAVAAPAKPKALKVSTPAGKQVSATSLLQLVAEQASLDRKLVKQLLETYYDVVKAHVLKGVKVKLGDVGTLLVRARKARTGRNPATGEPIKIKASKKLAFRPTPTLKDAVK